jgi:hypothetical protein
MKRVLVLAIFLGIAANPTLSQIPHTMSYQGILTDAAGRPVPDGTVALTFRLFDVASGGSSLWVETQQVTVSKGVFSAVLGTVTPLNLAFDKPYWLGMTVGQGTELVPRTALSASPYSMNSHSTIAEPAQGQGLTIRDTLGNASHTFNASGEALHTAKTTFRIPLGARYDTALVIQNPMGPAIVAVRSDTVSAHASATLSALKPVQDNGAAVEGYSELGAGVLGGSGNGNGVEGISISGIGTAGVSLTNNGVRGVSKTGNGVQGESSSGNGVNGTSNLGSGIRGSSTSSAGVFGSSETFVGVSGSSTSGNGVQGNSETGIGVTGVSTSGTGVHGKGSPAGLFDGEIRITTVNEDPTQERVLVWSTDQLVRYKTLPPAGSFDGVLVGKALVVKSASGVEVFRVDTTGASLHKGDETFEGDVILKGTGGKGAKWVDAQGVTLAGFGRVDLTTGQKIGVYGRAATAGDLAGAFEGDVDINGEVYASSLHVIGVEGDTVVHFNSDGTSTHKGLETYQAGLQTVLSNGNTLKLDPAAGLTLKTAGGQFRGHMDPNGNGLFAGNVGVAGNLTVSGTLQKGSGSFKIDHPLDPENKYLYHSFVESPDMKNIYDGVVQLDEQGEAEVHLPSWFEALNKDFRYQLTAIGAAAPNLHVSRKIHNNQFWIAGGEPGMEISWQITGTREDAYAKTHRIPVEEQKPVAERGHYLHPDAFGLSSDRGIVMNQKEGAQ